MSTSTNHSTQEIATSSSSLQEQPLAQLQSARIDHSVSRGILAHGEHWADLVFAEAKYGSGQHLTTLLRTARALLQGIREGLVSRVNEKFDGSPAVIFGRNSAGKPFVAYKGGFDRKSAQILFTTPEEIAAQYPENPALKALYGLLLEKLAPIIQENDLFKEYVFQGDILFTASDDRRAYQGKRLVIRANEVTYPILKKSSSFEKILEASVGIAIHTVGQRVVGGEGRVATLPEFKEDPLHRCAELFNVPGIFAIDPFLDNVPLTRKMPQRIAARIEVHLKDIENSLKTLGEPFKSVWGKRHEARVRSYFNHTVTLGENIFLKAKSGRKLNVSLVIKEYKAWINARVATEKEPKSYPKQLRTTLSEHRLEFQNVVRAFYLANRVQQLLQPYLTPALTSKLGPVRSEGIMLKDGGNIVKFVDRTDFTLRNAIRHERTNIIRAEYRTPLPFPFNTWRSGAAFVLGKFQPPHQGHIEMIRSVLREHTGEVFVIASDKEPDLYASNWKDFAATKNRKELIDGSLTHVFTPDLRRSILKAGLPKDARVLFLSPSFFWSYLERAKESLQKGPVTFVVGEKELEDSRYNVQIQSYSGQLSLLTIPPQHSGLSATQIRSLIKKAALMSDEAAIKTLLDHYSFIESPDERTRIVRALIRRWKRVAKIAKDIAYNEIDAE